MKVLCIIHNGDEIQIPPLSPLLFLPPSPFHPHPPSHTHMLTHTELNHSSSTLSTSASSEVEGLEKEGGGEKDETSAIEEEERGNSGVKKGGEKEEEEGEVKERGEKEKESGVKERGEKEEEEGGVKEGGEKEKESGVKEGGEEKEGCSGTQKDREKQKTKDITTFDLHLQLPGVAQPLDVMVCVCGVCVHVCVWYVHVCMCACVHVCDLSGLLPSYHRRTQCMTSSSLWWIAQDAAIEHAFPCVCGGRGWITLVTLGLWRDCVMGIQWSWWRVRVWRMRVGYHRLLRREEPERIKLSPFFFP